MKDIKALFEHRTTKILLLAIGALVLLLLIWKVFFVGERELYSSGATEQEGRIAEMLRKLNGIDRAYVMISEENGAPVSAIVFFEGDDSILVRIHILDVTSSALNIEKKNIQVYLA